jgi:hypothetical protein
MDQNERHIMTDDLFDRLCKAEEQTETRDPDPATPVHCGGVDNLLHGTFEFGAISDAETYAAT